MHLFYIVLEIEWKQKDKLMLFISCLSFLEINWKHGVCLLLITHLTFWRLSENINGICLMLCISCLSIKWKHKPSKRQIAAYGVCSLLISHLAPQTTPPVTPYTTNKKTSSPTKDWKQRKTYVKKVLTDRYIVINPSWK